MLKTNHKLTVRSTHAVFMHWCALVYFVLLALRDETYFYKNTFTTSVAKISFGCQVHLKAEVKQVKLEPILP